MGKAKTISKEIAEFVRGRSVTIREFTDAFPSSAQNGTLIAVLESLGYITRPALTAEEQREMMIKQLETKLARLKGEP